jgi:hypothetical protein
MRKIQSYAAWEAAGDSGFGCDSKYWSKVLVAAVRTTWQFEHEPKCCSMSFDTEGDSFPSKYQQIKWIVSLQLMTNAPSVIPKTPKPYR